jgi:hypothetical protein
VRGAIALCLIAACGSDHHQKPVDAPSDVPDDVGGCGGGCDAPDDAEPLDTLFLTGLCTDAACSTINTTLQGAPIYAYTPRFTLWADAASKRRWLWMPPGSQIDTTDPDHWVFPQGTRVWKEFSSGSTRVETRFITKLGTGNTVTDWKYIAYEWNAQNTDTIGVPFGDTNVNGTTHDIPSVSQCKGCHENFTPTRLLGIGAIQLDAAAVNGELDLDGMVTAGLLTTNPPAGTPHYPFPTDGTTDATNALGYMHANCGHCHNPSSNVYVFNGVTMVLRLDIGTLGSVATTPAYTTAVNQNATVNCCPPKTKIIVPTDPTMSIMIERFESTNPAIWMPQLGHKTMDPAGDAILTSWITHLP